MGRWIAIGKAPGWDDLKRFSQEMKDTSQWRIDPKSTVTSVYALGDGRMVAEYHGPATAEFEEWLKKKGWSVESLTPVKHIAKAGEIWKVA
jgi:flavodoxin